MQGYLVDNRFGTRLKPFSITFDSLIELVSNPNSVVDKSNTQLWMFVSLVDPDYQYRDQLNYDNVSVLQLDYDDGTTLDSVRHLFRPFKAVIYSSFSSTPEHNKFRVLLPLKNQIEYRLLKSEYYKESLKAYFGNIDPTCVTNFQAVPIINSKQPDNYFCCKSNGELFDIEVELKEFIFTYKTKIQIDQSLNNTINEHRKNNKLFKLWFENRLDYNNINQRKEAYKKKTELFFETEIDKIPKTTSGDRYNTLLHWIGKLVQAKYPVELGEEFLFREAEIVRFISSNCTDKNVMSAIEEFYQNR